MDAASNRVWQIQGNGLAGVSLRFMANWLGHHNQCGQTADLIEVTPDMFVFWKFFDGSKTKPFRAR